MPASLQPCAVTLLGARNCEQSLILYIAYPANSVPAARSDMKIKEQEYSSLLLKPLRDMCVAISVAF